ncbi:MAG: S66 peptidase family protein [Parcubacteria group bacterium]|jgi:muramoyltetrapeptide carboxypeptidase LdcA involved in peptidoglycan recycling
MLPQKLNPGDTVVIVSPSWGGPSVFPHVYENGLKILTEWGLKIKEYPTARADAGYLRKNPEVRAKDINNAFSDPEVKAIFTSIGGDDSVRILPYLNKETIKNNPKILMGFSDTTTLHAFCNQLGLVTFYGPSIMAGFSQMKNLPESFECHVREMLFESKDDYEYIPYGEYAEGYFGWSDKNIVGKTKELKKENDGWKFLQGSGIIRGELFGGCIEVLEMMKGTEFWPQPEFWNGKILVLETSEDKPTYSQVGWMLLNYGMQGIFDRIGGIVIGRARDYSAEEKLELEKKIISVVRDEFGRADLSIIANMDFGHTDPQFVLPLGAKAEIDCDNKKFKIVEPCLK